MYPGRTTLHSQCPREVIPVPGSYKETANWVSNYLIDPCFQMSDLRAGVYLFRYVGRVSYNCGHLWTLGKIMNEVAISTTRSLILHIVL